MKRFKEFLAEVFLLEGKIDDLKAQNPELHREIDKYAEADTSPTKKFVPWLVSQHKKGNVTPDDPDLHQTIQNFDRYRNIHQIKDHSSRSFQDVRDAVKPLIGTGSTKKEVAYEGRNLIHNSGDIQAYHVKTKEASQHFYGGGPNAGPTNTTWCVSARSKDCLFGSYGKMYTIHATGDPDSPYAVHPEHNKITNRHNDGDRNIDDEMSKKLHIAKLKPAIDAIRKHHDPHGFRLANSADLTSHEIDKAMGNIKDQKHLAQNPHSHIALAALNHPKATNQTTWYAAKHQNPQVAFAALNHPKADYITTWSAAENSNPQVALTALNHPKADNQTTWYAAKHQNPQIALTALNHSEADYATTRYAAKHPDPQVALAALNHSKADNLTVRFGTQHLDPQVALAALNHPKADNQTMLYGVQHPDPQVALVALNHPKAAKETTWSAVEHPDPQVALAALNHPKADNQTMLYGVQHPDPQVALVALNHPKATDTTTLFAAKHSNPQVALAALNHPKADNRTAQNAALHPNPQVQAAAKEKLKTLS